MILPPPRARLWLLCARDAFVALLPLTMLRAVVTLFDSLPWSPYQDLMDSLLGSGWHDDATMLLRLWTLVFGFLLAGILAARIAHELATPSEEDPVPTTVAVVCAMSGLGLVAALSIGFDADRTVYAVPLGLVTGIAAAETLCWAVRQRHLGSVRLDDDTDALLYNAVRFFLPVVTSVALVGVGYALVRLVAPAAHDVLAAGVDAAAEAGIWVLTLAAAVLVHLLWFLGIHGALIVDALLTENGLVESGPGSTEQWRPLFNSFVLLGGTGATAGLLIAILVGSRTAPQRRIAKISVPLGFFNINDVLVYGLPIVLNPLYLLSFLTAPLLLALMALTAREVGFIEIHDATVSWVTPPLVSGWMMTDSWRGAALQAVGIALSVAVYLPAVRRADRQHARLERQRVDNAVRAILAAPDDSKSVLDRRDQIGMTSRALLADLRAGLDRGALTLHYQPKHDVHGTVVGAEALLRWTHARHGPIPAYAAVSLAEDSGDIVAIGAWALAEACAAKARWNAAGHSELTLAVNVSAKQLVDRSLAKHIRDCLAANELAPSELELEITESAAIPQEDVVASTLRDVVALDIKLAMDDFGMGHSSLLYLRRFPVSAIKLDGQLTREALHSPTTADIIESIATLGHSLDAEVVAEFVETDAQRDKLATLGCDIFQGHLYSPALDEQAFLDYLSRSS